MSPLCFRETGTQTSNNFDAALEMVRNTLQQTSISNDPSYFNLNKPQGYEILENVFHTHRTTFYKMMKEQHLESHNTSSSSKIDAVSDNSILSSSIETEGADQALPISYKCCNANTTPYSSPYWFIDDGTWKNLDRQYNDVDNNSGTVLDDSFRDGCIANAMSYKTKTKTAPKYNILKNRYEMSKPLQQSTIQAASTINHGVKNSHSSVPPQKLDYLELHTHNPRMDKFTILPVKLPSPLITSIIPGRHLESTQDNPDSITRSSCKFDTKLRYNDDLGSYQLERCQFTIKGVDGLTRNANIDFTTSGNRSK